MVETYPLTQPQERIWYTQQIYPDSCMFNIGGIILLHGNIDLELLLQAINNTIRLHDAFRLQFYKIEESPVQYQVEQASTSSCAEILDFSNHKVPRMVMEKYFQQRFEMVFELIHRPLFEFAVFKAGKDLNGFFVKMHHIIADGWSVQILTRDIGKAYDELLRGRGMANEGSSYINFIHDDQGYINSERLQKDRAFWMNELMPIPEKTRELHESVEGARKSYFLDHLLTSRIRNFCKKNQISENVFMIGVYALYKHLHEQNNDIVIGLPVLGRFGKKNKNTIGMFVSSIPLRIKIRNNDSIIDFLQKLSARVALAYRHQRYSYHHLSRDLNFNNTNLYTDCLNFYGTSLCDEYGGVPSSNIELYNGQQQYNMQIIIRDWKKDDGNRFQIDVDYKSKLYSDVYIDNIFDNIMYLANNFCSNEMEEMQDIQRIPIKYDLLYSDFNQTYVKFPEYDNVIASFKYQVSKNPTKTAIRFGNQTIDYAELDRLSDNVDLFLNENFVQSGEIVGVYMSHCIETIIAILGILKAGCSFLAIDPQIKTDRISYMLEDANANVLFHNLVLPDDLKFSGQIFSTFYPDACGNQKVKQDIYTNYNDAMAYIIYTSGSTGQPKGVVVSHRNLINYIFWAWKAYEIQQDDTWPLYSSLSFDLTITSIFLPLVSGGTIVIYNDLSESKNSSAQIMERIALDNLCSVIKLTPAHLYLLRDEIITNSRVKKLIVGGENLRYKLAKSIYDRSDKNVTIYNEYGPTEATVGCMIHCFNPDDDGGTVPIGHPSANNRIFLLNEYLEPVPHGEKGEIYISGLSVTAGYLNNPVLTSEKFIRISNEMILYKTGDIACFKDSQTLVCFGRNDSQVKLMGYRIEPDEISSTLQRCNGVEHVDVVPYSGLGDHVNLYAYYTGKEFLKSELDSFLNKFLPFYMMPTDYIWLETFPLTNNGKIDRAALPSPKQVTTEIYESDIIADLEKSFFEVAQQVLNNPNLFPVDNFYQLGGDSIKAVQLSSRLHEMGFQLKVKDILNSENISGIIKMIKVQNEASFNMETCSGTVQYVPIVEWFFEQELYNPSRYCQYSLLTFDHSIDLNVLENVLFQLIKHHDALRMNYDAEKKQLFYNSKYLTENVHIKEFSEINLGLNRDYNKNIEQLIDLLDISNKPLIQTGVINHEDCFVWCLVVHHLAIDGVSWRILLEDIDTLVRQYKSGIEFALPSKTDSYQKWAEYALSSRVIMNSHSNIQRQIRVEDLNVARKMIQLYSELSEAETGLLFSNANDSYHTKPVEIMLTALVLTIPVHMEFEQSPIEVEFHGRDDIDCINITRTVGWFTRISVLNINQQNSMHDAVLNVKETYRKMYQLITFSPLVFSKTEQNVIRFNYLGEIKGEYDHFVFTPQQFNHNEMTAAIEMDLAIRNGKLICQCRINHSILQYRSTIEGFCDTFMNTLSDTISYCLRQDEVILSPADFDLVELSEEDLQHLFQS